LESKILKKCGEGGEKH
jgi:hypothetical protein